MQQGAIGRVSADLEVEVERGPAAGQRYTLVGDLRLGSAEEGAGNLGGDPWLSASHALVHRSVDGWAVEDLRSLDGTRVNGEPVRGARTLRPGDALELGSTRIVVLPEGVASLAELRRAPAAAGSADSTAAPALRNENRRKLDGRRVLATIIDGAAAYPIWWLFQNYTNGALAALVAAMALQMTLSFACESLTGQTLGKKLTGLRVVRLDGRPLSPQAVSIRTVLRLLDGTLLGLIALVATGKRRQRLGDLAAGTVLTRASTPAPPPTRQRLTLLGYPLLWLAPAALIFVFMPGGREQPCARSSIATDAREGTCLAAGGVIVTTVNLGHTLHMPEYDARLVRTAVRHAAIPRLARYGFPGGRVALVGFRVAVKNTSGGRLVLDRGGDLGLYAVALPDGREQAIAEVPPRLRGGFSPLGGRRGAAIAAGRTRTGWIRFAVAADLVPQLDLTRGELALRSGSDRHVGEIRLWRAASIEGAASVVALRRAG